jgi:hypothetical protein
MLVKTVLRVEHWSGSKLNGATQSSVGVGLDLMRNDKNKIDGHTENSHRTSRDQSHCVSYILDSGQRSPGKDRSIHWQFY